jgi:hypothetical protein
VDEWGLITRQQILDTLSPEVRQAFCEHEGHRRVYANGPVGDVIGWRCLECDATFRGWPPDKSELIPIERPAP